MIGILVLSLLTQFGECKAGQTCRAFSFQPPCVTTAQLTACATSTRGRMMCDLTRGCMVFCNGTAWSCIGTALTAPSSGWTTDGGTTYTTQRVAVYGSSVDLNTSVLRVDGGIVVSGPTSTGAILTFGGSARGDVNVQGDFYASQGLTFSIGYTSGNVSAKAIDSTSTLTTGSITLVAGTGTATVQSGANCTCVDRDATPVVLRCPVSGTTLTASEATGTSTHTISYNCL